MNKKQTFNFLEEIKGYYRNFEISDNIVNQWYSKLKNYDRADLDEALDKYLKAGNKYEPTLSELISNLPTLETKEKNSLNGLFICDRCGRYYKSLEEQQRCEERCMDIAYIWKMSEKFNIDGHSYFGGNLSKASLEVINAGYDKFILRIIEEQKKTPKLNSGELEGIKSYYENVIKKGGMIRNDF